MMACATLVRPIPHGIDVFLHAIFYSTIHGRITYHALLPQP